MGFFESRQSVSLILTLSMFLLSRLSFLPSWRSLIYILPHYKHTLPFAVVFLSFQLNPLSFFTAFVNIYNRLFTSIFTFASTFSCPDITLLSLLILLSLSAPLKHPPLQHLHPISSLSLSLTLSLALSLWDALTPRLQIIAGAFTERQISMKGPH